MASGPRAYDPARDIASVRAAAAVPPTPKAPCATRAAASTERGPSPQLQIWRALRSALVHRQTPASQKDNIVIGWLVLAAAVSGMPPELVASAAVGDQRGDAVAPVRAERTASTAPVGPARFPKRCATAPPAERPAAGLPTRRDPCWPSATPTTASPGTSGRAIGGSGGGL
jgi:hypothetical protein